jgi:hypothetical protein
LLIAIHRLQIVCIHYITRWQGGATILLTGLYVMVVGGDERQLEVIQRLHELDAFVKAVGFELEQDRTTDQIISGSLVVSKIRMARI